jgi:phosphotransferase system HPr-like phosphotransfer protein
MTLKGKNVMEETGAEAAGASSETRRSLHTIISEEEFLKPLRENLVDFFSLASSVIDIPANFSARFYFNLRNEAQTLETFLDDHGARDNLTWNYFAELVASIRNFAIAAFQLSHILHRYRDYHPLETEQASEEFLAHGLEAMEFINGIEQNLIKEALEELKRRGCKLEREELIPPNITQIRTDVRLPQNILADKYKTSEQRILRIAENYRKMAVRVHRDRYGKKIEPAELAKLIPSRVNETKVKILENTLHTIQSEYDTHIKKTDFETKYPELVTLRGYISLPMHLLEMTRWIIHFYERHENEIHTDESRNRISEIVNKELVLRLISQFSFFYIHKFMSTGKLVAEKLMSRLVRKTRIKLSVPKPSGFHARPAFYVTLVVEEHGTDVFMYVGNRKFDARSVLDLLEAGGLTADLGADEVEFEGDERTLADLKILAESNYCENEKVPKELNYIRVARNVMA